MHKSDVKHALNMLFTFGKNLKRDFYRYRRYAIYSCQAVWEKMHGVDFTIRDLSLLDESDGTLHGYSKTDGKHVEAIMDSLGVTRDMRLLDIGCGKGSFLKDACKYPFADIAGLEYSSKLANIARKNMKQLGLENKVTIFHGDALKFKKYNSYNVFYFFNPFGSPIMQKVLDKIEASCEDDFYIILHNPVCADDVLQHNCKEIIHLFDKVKQYSTVIYKHERQEAAE